MWHLRQLPPCLTPACSTHLQRRC